jgi:hypothetical protein
MAGIVYILTNAAMPGLVKIGKTQDLAARIADLSSSSGVPLRFECHFAAEVEDPSRLEGILHQIFNDTRINPKREFFRADPEKVAKAISIGAFKDVTPGGLGDPKDEEVQAVEREQRRRSNTNLAALGIEVGAVLSLSRDPSVTCEVLEGNRVRFKGQDMSLSGSAVQALQELGYKASSVSGAEYWMLGDETLSEIRQRLEERFGQE